MLTYRYMPGGLLQLIAVGQVDQYLSINPELSFYQYVYKRHTSFALESRHLIFERNPILSPVAGTQSYQCNIGKYADLLSNLYFCFTLPEVYSSDKYKFRWVKNVGSVFVKHASVFIDGTQIDQTTGEWMTIWNELSSSDIDNYSTMLGNVPEMYEPKMSHSRVTIKNNKFIYYYYPESSKLDGNEPSINSRQIIVPLNFWFCKNPALALPLLRLQFSIVSIKIDIESSESLYQVFSDKLNRYVSPTYYNEIHNENININTFTKTLDIEPYIEANYVFLGEEERNTLFLRSKLTYLVEQLTINSAKNTSSTSSGNENIKVIINNPTKELVWVVKRDDYSKYNEHHNYSPDIPESTNRILEKAIIRFNSNNRIEEKPEVYFRMIQPFQHHSNVPSKGVYCYSFALYPEKELLSGYYNAALVDTHLSVILKNTYNNDVINRELVKIGREPYKFNYLVLVYALTYNFFEIVGGQAGMKFAFT